MFPVQMALETSIMNFLERLEWFERVEAAANFEVVSQLTSWDLAKMRILKHCDEESLDKEGVCLTVSLPTIHQMTAHIVKTSYPGPLVQSV